MTEGLRDRGAGGYHDGHLLPHRLCDPVGGCQVEPDFSLGIHWKERDKEAQGTEALGRRSTWVAGDHPDQRAARKPARYVSTLHQRGAAKRRRNEPAKTARHFWTKMNFQGLNAQCSSDTLWGSEENGGGAPQECRKPVLGAGCQRALCSAFVYTRRPILVPATHS